MILRKEPRPKKGHEPQAWRGLADTPARSESSCSAEQRFCRRGQVRIPPGVAFAPGNLGVPRSRGDEA